MTGWFQSVRRAIEQDPSGKVVSMPAKVTIPMRIEAVQKARDRLIDAIEELARRRKELEHAQTMLAREIHDLDVGVTVTVDPLPDELTAFPDPDEEEPEDDTDALDNR